MKQERFEELCDAVREAGKIVRGKQAPARAWEVKQAPSGKIARKLVDPELHRKEVAAKSAPA